MKADGTRPSNRSDARGRRRAWVTVFRTVRTAKASGSPRSVHAARARLEVSTDSGAADIGLCPQRLFRRTELPTTGASAMPTGRFGCPSVVAHEVPPASVPAFEAEASEAPRSIPPKIAVPDLAPSGVTFLRDPPASDRIAPSHPLWLVPADCRGGDEEPFRRAARRSPASRYFGLEPTRRQKRRSSATFSRRSPFERLDRSLLPFMAQPLNRPPLPWRRGVGWRPGRDRHRRRALSRRGRQRRTCASATCAAEWRSVPAAGWPPAFADGPAARQPLLRRRLNGPGRWRRRHRFDRNALVGAPARRPAPSPGGAEDRRRQGALFQRAITDGRKPRHAGALSTADPVLAGTWPCRPPLRCRIAWQAVAAAHRVTRLRCDVACRARGRFRCATAKTAAS